MVDTAKVMRAKAGALKESWEPRVNDVDASHRKSRKAGKCRRPAVDTCVKAFDAAEHVKGDVGAALGDGCPNESILCKRIWRLGKNVNGRIKNEILAEKLNHKVRIGLGDADNSGLGLNAVC